MGPNAFGSSLSLIAPSEDKAHDAIVSALGGSKKLFEPVILDGRLLHEAQERVNMASKIVAADEIEARAKKTNSWYHDAAKEAGLEVDDDMMEEGLAGSGDLKDAQQLRQAKQAKNALRVLLARPMVTNRFGKFLSSHPGTAGKQQHNQVTPYVVPMEAAGKSRKKKNSKRGRKN